MKRVIVAFAIVIAVFAVGCQDSISTGPPSNAGHQLLKNNPVNQILNFKGYISPGSSETTGGGVSFQVIGQAFIAYTIIGIESDPFISFSINVEADLTPNSPILPSGSIGNHSEYQISLASKVGVIYVTRDYYVENVGTKLHIVFAVAEDNSFSVESMSLDPLVVTQGTANTN